MFFGVKRADTETDATVNVGCADAFMAQGSTMEAGAAGNVIIHIQHCSGVEGLKSVHIKQENADVVLEIFQAIKGDTLHILQTVPQHGG